MSRAVGTGTVAVLGATGKTGRAVTAAALRSGLDVRATSRRAHPEGGGPGGGDDETVVGPCRHDDTDPPRSGRAGDRPGRLTWHRVDLLTGDGLAEALTGAEAAYLIVPNVHPDEVTMVTLAARTATEVGVERVVYHSVADPDDARMAHHLRKGEAEQVLRELRPEAVVLRPCAYQQNLLGAALAGHVEVPYRLTVPFSLVDLDDVAEVAAAALAGRLDPGSSHDLGGPEELTVEDLARTAAQTLGRPVTAASITPEQWRTGPGAGSHVQGSALEELLAMFAAYDQTGFTADPAPLTRLLGRPPTTWTELLSKEGP